MDFPLECLPGGLKRFYVECHQCLETKMRAKICTMLPRRNSMQSFRLEVSLPLKYGHISNLFLNLNIIFLVNLATAGDGNNFVCCRRKNGPCVHWKHIQDVGCMIVCFLSSYEALWTLCVLLFILYGRYFPWYFVCSFFASTVGCLR